jgi:DNA-directed RNA polymerase specialized sigma24 family protein
MDQKEYKRYQEIVKKITKGSELSEDLLHDTIIQLSTNDKWNTLPAKEKVFFFIRTITNQFYSNNSYFHKTYKRFQFQEITSIEQIETEYEDKPTLEWVNEELEKELKERPENWYDVELFRLYLQDRRIDAIHRKTKIPKYSIRITIKEMKKWINTKWIEYKNGES